MDEKKVELLEKYDKKEIKYIKIKDLTSRYSLSKTKSGILNVKDEWDSKLEKYDWKALEDSIKIHGIKKPLLASWKSGNVGDGNHRLAVLKLLYSPNKKVPCIQSLKQHGPSFFDERDKELEFHENERKFALENDIAFKKHANVGKIIKIYK